MRMLSGCHIYDLFNEKCKMWWSIELEKNQKSINRKISDSTFCVVNFSSIFWRYIGKYQTTFWYLQPNLERMYHQKLVVHTFEELRKDKA